MRGRRFRDACETCAFIVRCVAVEELRFTDLGAPGITRRRTARGFRYVAPDGSAVRDPETVARLNACALPPAYADAWYCADPQGHIQATGVDARGRRQYRYHPQWHAERDAAKYDRCAAFGRALPAIRAAVEADLAGRGLGHDRVIAAVVRLLDLGAVRVGNEEYARTNKSFGATTLRNRHARVEGDAVRLSYTGKSGQKQVLRITDRRLANVVRRCQDLPGQHLFQWEDADGAAHRIGSADVNAYLREHGGEGFTAKNFRTWAASVIAFRLAHDAGEAGAPLKEVLAAVAATLGNTPAVSRRSYIHPEVLALCGAAGRLHAPLPRATRWLSRHERGLIAFLEACSAASGEACGPVMRGAAAEALLPA